MSQLKRQVCETISDYDREKVQERLVKLAGGVAVINVGAGRWAPRLSQVQRASCPLPLLTK